MDYKKIAGALLEAIDIYEASYVPGQGSFLAGAFRVQNPGQYTLSCGLAADKALPEDPVGARLVELLMLTAWNDAQDWARKILENRP